MTTEDGFHAILDNAPEDWQTRMVFADWLEERGDSRAAGYRALALRHMPDRTSNSTSVLMWHWWRRREDGHAYPSERVSLPSDWYDNFPGVSSETVTGATPRRDFATRRAAEDTAATAFAKLPADRRAELLALSLERV